MRHPSFAICVAACAFLTGPAPAIAASPSFGVMVRHDDSCLPGSYTGVREGPDDPFGPAGTSFGCPEGHLARTNVGLVVAVPLSRRFAIRADPGLATNGYEFYHRSLTLVRLDYFQLPVHARFLIVPGGSVHPYLLAGGFIARRRHPGVLVDEGAWGDWNAGVSGGGGLLFDLPPVQVFGELVYERGLVDVYVPRNLDRHTQSLRVAGGITFRLGR